MISKYDIQKLQDLPIEQVADALGLTVKRHKAICPFHDDSHPSLTFSTSRNRYRCYVCDARGGTIDLVMNYGKLGFYDACQWLANHESVTLCPEPVRKKSLRPPLDGTSLATNGTQEPPALDLHYLEGLVAHPYLCPEAEDFLFNQRHLSPRVVSDLGLSSISRPVPMSGNPNGTWFNAPSLLIPYRDINGKLLSVQARYLGKDKDCPRFQFPKGSRCSIYNLPILCHLEAGEPLFVTEGCSDCWSMLSSGHKAIAIPSATALNEDEFGRLWKSLSHQPSALHLYPDNDKAGESLYNRLLEASIHFGFTLVRHQLPPTCKDFSDYYLQSLIHDN